MLSRCALAFTGAFAFTGACATERGRDEVALTPSAAPTARDAASSPSTSTSTLTSISATHAALARFAAAVVARDAARVGAVLACATAVARDAACASLPAPVDVDDASLKAALSVRARDPQDRATQAGLARAVIEDALAPGRFERTRRRRMITFKDAAAVFAVDDVSALVDEAHDASARALILAAARAALEVALAVSLEERAVVEKAAVRAGMTRAELIARRAGLNEAALRRLVDDVLRETASMAAHDTREACDVGAAHRVDSHVIMAAAKASTDPTFLVAAGRAAKIGSREVACLVVAVRNEALGMLAVLDGAGVDGNDALASRVADDGAALHTGASALLDVDESGVGVERLVALLRTPALAQRLLAGASLETCAHEWSSAPSVDEQGFPEAFVTVLPLLAELAR